MLHDLRTILSFARISLVTTHAKRALGAAWAEPPDFFPLVSQAEQFRLAEIAVQLRGAEAPSAIFIHGVMPRSGTNFLSDILSLHPNVQQDPGRLWEFPLLYVAPGADALQQEFQFMFPRNAEVMGRFEFLAYIASAWMKLLQEQAGDKRMLFKVPHMQNIGLFPSIFPKDVLFLLIRDGRDVVASSLTTFRRPALRRKSFSTLVRQWRDSTEAALSFASQVESARGRSMVVRYEDLVVRVKETVPALLQHAQLDARTFGWPKISTLPVRGSSESTAPDDTRWMAQAKRSSFAPVGRWRSWPRYRVNRFKEIAGETLIKADYETSNDW